MSSPSRRFDCRAALRVTAFAALLAPAPLGAQNVVQWELEDESLLSDDGLFELLPEAAPPAVAPELFFDELEIGGQSAEVLAFGHGTYFRAPYSFPPNGGGEFLNQYTLVLDVMFEDRSPGEGWACLLNTNNASPPANDGDWFVNPAGGIGISGNYGGLVEDGVWHRLALAVDLAAGTYTSYIDGVQVQQNTADQYPQLDLDERFSLYLDVILLFADDDGEASPGFVSSVQLRDEALSPSQIAALGGPCAEGIGKCPTGAVDCFEVNFSAAYEPAAESVALSWNTAPADSGYRIRRDGVQIGGDLAAGTGSFTDPDPPASSSPEYTLEVLRGGGPAGECRVTVAAFTCPSGLTCCPDQATSTVELTWAAGTNLDFTSYQLLRDGAPVGSPAPGETSFTDGAVPGPGVYTYELALAGAGGACAAGVSCVTTITGIEIRAPGACGGVVAQYDFDGDLASSAGGPDLIPQISAPLVEGIDPPDYEFLTMPVGGEDAEVMRYGRGTVFKLRSHLPPNGGGQYVNQYTLVMDVLFPAGALDASGWAPFFNTNCCNANDGDWFLRGSDRGIGIGGNYGGRLEDDTWYRIALVVDLVAGTYRSTIDGVEVEENTGLDLDGRFSLYGVGDPDDGFHLFADENGENAPGFVNSVQVRDVAMSPGEVAALGGPAAGGIPFSTPYVCPSEVTCCADQKARSVEIRWDAAAGLPGLIIRRDGEPITTTDPGASSYTDTAVPPGTHEYTFSVDGEIDCENAGLHCRVTLLGEHFFFDDFDCYASDADLAAAGWQATDTGDPVEAATWTLADPLGRGNPPGPDGRATTGRFVISDSDFGGDAGRQNVLGSGMSHDLWSPSFSTAGSDTVWLHMDLVAQLNNDGDAVFDVDLSTDGGMTWANVFRRVSPGRSAEPLPSLDPDNADGPFGRIHVDLSGVAANAPEVRLRLRHYEPTWDWFVAADNVLVDAVPAAGGPVEVLAEDFAGGIPASWSVESGPGSDLLSTWNTADTCGLSLVRSGGAFPDLAEGRQLHHLEDAFALADPFCSFAVHDEYLITPALDLRTARAVTFEVASAVIPTDDAVAEILLSLDGGESFEPEPLFSYNGGGTFLSEEEPFFNEYVFPVEEAAGRPDVAFAFHYRSLGGAGSPGTWWAVSRVRVTAEREDGGTRFVRGDVDRSGVVNLTDGVQILLHLFNAQGLPAPLGCLDAADTDDSGGLNLTDGVSVFLFLFRGGDIPVPSPETTGPTTGADPSDCARDPTDDGVECAEPPGYCG